MDIKLERFAYTSLGTFGKMYVEGMSLIYTVERPWIPDERFEDGGGGKLSESCIPEGTYKLKPTDRPVHPDTYVLINDDLKVHEYEKDKMSRSDILIHIGNTMRDVIGCIAVGNEFACLTFTNPPMPGVLNSKDTYRRLRYALGQTEEHKIVISQYRPFGD